MGNYLKPGTPVRFVRSGLGFKTNDTGSVLGALGATPNGGVLHRVLNQRTGKQVFPVHTDDIVTSGGGAGLSLAVAGMEFSKPQKSGAKVVFLHGGPDYESGVEGITDGFVGKGDGQLVYWVRIKRKRVLADWPGDFVVAGNG